MDVAAVELYMVVLSQHRELLDADRWNHHLLETGFVDIHFMDRYYRTTRDRRELLQVSLDTAFEAIGG